MSEQDPQDPAGVSGEMATLEIRKGPEAELTGGGLRFVACRREVGDIDGGITLQVWGETPGPEREPIELLRFDLFRGKPHYHAPAEKQEETAIDSADAVAWGVEALTARAGDFVAEAGYGDVGDGLDPAALLTQREPLARMLADLEEPNEISLFEVPRAVLDGLAQG